MAVIVQWPPNVAGSLCFSNGSGLHHIPSQFELDQIKRGWPGIQTVDATKWPATVVHQLYGPDAEPWGSPPPAPTPPGGLVPHTHDLPAGETGEALASSK